jgi:pyrroline-5-carboxylate reductase
MADGAVFMGMPKSTALELVAQTMFGTAKLFLDSPTSQPSVLRDVVTTPGGCTAAGLLAMEEGGIRAALMHTVRKTTLRAAELGKSVNPASDSMIPRN